jgi:hypothetical protein
LGQAFGVEGYYPAGAELQGGAYPLSTTRTSYDDDIRLTPYTGFVSHPGSPQDEDLEEDKLHGLPMVVV